VASGAVQRLTDHPAEDWDPAFTPDGEHLLWSSNRSGNFEVWVAAADGSGPRRLTHDGVDAENPTASADGWVVYASSNPAHPGVWKVRRDGSGASRIVAGAEAQHPELSPDGAHVLYHARRGSQEELRAVRLADGVETPFRAVVRLDHPASLRVLGELSIAVGRGRWRPDGEAVLFVGLDDAGRLGIFEQPFAPGGRPEPVVLSEGDAFTETFALSPDARRLTVSFREQASNLMLVQDVPGVTAPVGAARDD
jgi:Tol biopolymer transport system component